ncbi:MAG: MarR family transcriptional regulator [Minwuia sp.]|nr:MarR family transcriptional regulator [Minwuia sp.]
MTETDIIDLPNFLPYRLAVATDAVSGRLARRYREEFDLSIPEWRVMAVLGRYPEISAGEVAARSAMDKVQVSRAVAQLLRNGHLDRRSDAQDRRRTVLNLSSTGRAIYGRIVPMARAYEQDLFDRLTPEEGAILLSALARLSAP